VLRHTSRTHATGCIGAAGSTLWLRHALMPCPASESLLTIGQYDVCMSAPMRTEPRFLTVAQAAVALGVSGPTIRRWISEGRLGAIQVGGPDGVLRVPEAELERLVADARQDTP